MRYIILIGSALRYLARLNIIPPKPQIKRKEYTVLAVFNMTMLKRNHIVYENLATVIIEQYLTIPDIAYGIGISPDIFKDKFFGKEAFTLEEASDIAGILEKDVEYLFQELA